MILLLIYYFKRCLSSVVMPCEICIKMFFPSKQHIKANIYTKERCNIS
ncbi:hypothetical protein HMPREF1860_00177 [Prevotella amnii]|uniref:Uncharacterized protein n=1 Tax=Prevotella amnii TaxID=419005 RepID=A0A134BNA1_9BACT|nr:hypothetical protein HMPREF1860_00177 [Prevotella amnii]